jgi:hypothetical protein
MHAFVPGFLHDIFISYAHRDDPAWVAAFERSLREAVAQRLGSDIVVWQDVPNIRVGDTFSNEIEGALEGSAIVVALSSPSYLNSDWCTSERATFARHLERSGGLHASGRFFVAVKAPMDDVDGHSVLPDLQQILFYRPGDRQLPETEFVPGSEDFKNSIRRLAFDIANRLRRLRSSSQRIFIGSPHDDCIRPWRQLASELRKHYDVQPPARRDAAFAEALLQSEMKDARLSVHLLGAAYDAFAERQILLAADANHRLLIWIAAAASQAEPRQEGLLASLRNGVRPGTSDAQLPAGWAVVADKGPRKLIDDVLEQMRATTAPTAATEGNADVYIIQDATTEEDTRVARSIADLVAQQEHFTVAVSRADLGSSRTVQDRHERMMKTCRGVLLYRKAAPDAWLRQLAPEVILAERLLNRQPLRSKAFLLPDTGGWDGVPDLKVIPYTPGFQVRDLETFLAPLRGAA